MNAILQKNNLNSTKTAWTAAHNTYARLTPGRNAQSGATPKFKMSCEWKKWQW